MKVRRQVTSRAATAAACGIQLLCVSLLIHAGTIEAAPQGLFNFTPDSQKIFNDFSNQHSGLVVPAVQLKGPNFISAPEPTISISQSQEPERSISQSFEDTLPIAQPEPTISISQQPEPTVFISQPQENSQTIIQPETTITVSQPQEQQVSFSQPQFTHRNSLPQDSSISQNSFIPDHQLQANKFVNSQPGPPQQQPDFIIRSQHRGHIFNQQNIVNSQPFISKGIQESVAVIRDTDPVLLPQENLPVKSQSNPVESVNNIDNNVRGEISSTGGESSLVSHFPKEEVVEVPIPFVRNFESNSVEPEISSTKNQNRNLNTVQPQTTFIESSGRNLNTNSPIGIQAIESTEGNKNNGIPLSSVVSTISENINGGVPISATTNLGTVNNNAITSQTVAANTISGDSSNGVPLTSIVSVASEDNTLSSPQNPASDDASLMALISSAINGDPNLESSLMSNTDTNSVSDFGSQTLGEVLLNLNGQNGIVVLPMDSLNDSTVSELMGTNGNQDITFRADDGSSDSILGANDESSNGDLSSLLDAFVSDNIDEEEFEVLPPAPPSPPDIFRSTLSDTMFVKGQWLGTLLGGLIDIGEAVTGKLRELKPKN